MPRRHREHHRTDRIGWLRAAVLGANAGIVTTASLILGVATAQGGHSSVLVAGHAGLIPLVSATSLMFLALLGGVTARAGGARVAMGALRVTFWGALAMGVTAGIGALFGTLA